MDTPGITVQPIIMTSGEHIQNQIFFDNVRVPVANVAGQIDDGWTVAKYLLEFERGGSAYAPGLQVRLGRIREMASEGSRPLIAEGSFAARLAAAQVRVDVLEMYEFQALSAAAKGGRPGLSGSVMKIMGTELSQHLTELALEAAGPYGQAFQPAAGAAGGPNVIDHGPGWLGPKAAAIAPLKYLNDRAGSIMPDRTRSNATSSRKRSWGFSDYPPVLADTPVRAGRRSGGCSPLHARTAWGRRSADRRGGDRSAG